MRPFALLTSAFVLGLAAFGVVMPSADAYIPGVDDGPPQRFSTVEDAAKAAGYYLPNPENQPGWHVEAAIVTPVYYGRKLLDELLVKPVRTFPTNQGSGLVFVRPGPDPPRDLHNYVHITYQSEAGVMVTLSFNVPRVAPVATHPPSSIEQLEESRVVISDVPAKLVTYKTGPIEVMSTVWKVDGVWISATAINLSENPNYRITADEFLAFLASVR